MLISAFSIHGNQAQDEIDALQEELDERRNADADAESDDGDTSVADIKRKLEAVISIKVARISQLETELGSFRAEKDAAQARIVEMEGLLKEQKSELLKQKQQRTASVWKKVKLQAKKAEEVEKCLLVGFSCQIILCTQLNPCELSNHECSSLSLLIYSCRIPVNISIHVDLLL